VAVQSLTQASAALATWPASQIIAGGTSLLPRIKRGLTRPTHLISLLEVPGLDQVHQTPTGIEVGAACSIANLARSDTVSQTAPAIAELCSTIATPAVRNMATVGGSLCAPGSTDLSVLLLAHDARILVADRGTERWLNVSQFLKERAETAAASRLIHRVVVDCSAETKVTRMARWSARGRSGRPTLTVVTQLHMVDGVCSRAAIVVGGVGDTPVRLERTAAVIEQQVGGPRAATGVATLAADEIGTVTDRPATDAHERRMVGVLVRRLLESIDEEAA
jgi:CO/xanthine dehydrogenase FAD-binding subunit